MRRILTLTLLSLGLSGGVALADDRHNDEHHGDRHGDRDRRVDEGRGHYDRGWYYRGRVHYRDYRYRPPYQYERFYDRPGYRWRSGEWIWNGFEWIWRPGYYIRITF